MRHTRWLTLSASGSSGGVIVRGGEEAASDSQLTPLVA